MHSFGVSVSNGSTEETVSVAGPSSENGMFTNGDTAGGGTSDGGGTARVVGSGANVSTNGAIIGSTTNNYTNGAVKQESNDEMDDFEEKPYMNGNSFQPPNKSSFVAKSPTDVDIIRLIGQQLRIMGLDQTVEQLIHESGCRLDHPTASKFRNHVMNGEWDKAESSLQELKSFLEDPGHLITMKFLILEQKYLECIEDERNAEAVYCLRNEITPLNYNKEKLPKICRYLFTNSLDELKKVAKWEGKGQASRTKLMEQLQKFLPPSIMLPPRRLQNLISQAIDLQRDRCPYHNYRQQENNLDDVSLLVDHACDKNKLPSEPAFLTLSEHRDEVWYCQFSHDGTRLATGSKDGVIHIWDVCFTTFQVTHRNSLIGHTFGIAYFVWSPDDNYLVALGPEEGGEFWLWDMQTCSVKYKGGNQNDECLTACAWHKDSKKFVVGGTKGQFYQVDLNGTIIDTWEGVRVQALSYKNDGKTVLAADTHYRIRGYNFEEMTDFNIIKEDHSIMSFVLDETGRYALLNIENQGVHMWDLEDRVLIRKFQGITQGYYTIHSCFGGADQIFVASGSEDNKVYIWHTKRERPISVLKGHTRTVNCVSWNPRLPNMLASCSDDTTVKIWIAGSDVSAKKTNTTEEESSNSTNPLPPPPPPQPSSGQSSSPSQPNSLAPPPPPPSAAPSSSSSASPSSILRMASSVLSLPLASTSSRLPILPYSVSTNVVSRAGPSNTQPSNLLSQPASQASTIRATLALLVSESQQQPFSAHAEAVQLQPPPPPASLSTQASVASSLAQSSSASDESSSSSPSSSGSSNIAKM